MAGQCELLLEGLRWMWSKEKGCNVMAGLFADLPLLNMIYQANQTGMTIYNPSYLHFHKIISFLFSSRPFYLVIYLYSWFVSGSIF